MTEDELAEYGTFGYRREGAVVHWWFTGHDANKPPRPDAIQVTGTYIAT